MAEPKLTGMDYMTRPHIDLRSHPDFNPHAYRIIIEISKMNSSEISNIDIHSVKIKGKH